MANLLVTTITISAVAWQVYCYSRRLGLVTAIELAAMPLIALILSTLGFWVLYWFVRIGGLCHLQDRKAQRQETTRRTSAHDTTRAAPLRAVDDPRDAALILMLVLARGDAEVTSDQLVAVERIARAEFDCEDDWIGRMTQARFLANRTESFDQAAAVFADLFDKCLTIDERRQLLAMLQQVAPEPPSVGGVAAMASFRRQLGLASA